MNAKKWITVVSVAVVGALSLWALSGCKEDKPAAKQMRSGTVQAATVQTTCPVMGGAINKDIHVEHEGKNVYFCCQACVDQFKADPAKYLDKLPQFQDMAETAGAAVEGAGSTAQATLAGLTDQKICPIMGNPINTSIYVEHEGKKVYFCCAGCIEKFKAEPEKYISQLPQFKN